MSSFWRKELPVLNQHGEIIKGGMWKHQLDWWNLPNFVKALITGYGGGKTFSASKRLISLALLNAPSPALSISPSYRIAKRTTISTIRELLEGKQRLFGKNVLRYKFNKTDHEFTIRYRGKVGHIWIASGQDEASLRGPNIGAGHIDEPFIQDRDVLDQLVARVRDPKARHKEILLTGTPEELNWGYDICEGDESDQFDIGVIHASTRDNLVLGDDYADRMERAFTEEMAEAYVEGQFVSLSKGRVYYGFKREANVISIPYEGEVGVGMDFNVDPMACIVFFRSGNHMHYLKEYEFPNADTEYVCSVLKEEWGDRLTKCYPDATGQARKTAAPRGKSDFTYIKQAGMEIEARPTNPLVRDRENAVNAKYKPKEGVPTLTVDPSCKRLIKYLLTYAHEKKNKQKEMSHLLDAAGYPVAFLFPIDRETIQLMRMRGF